MRILITGANSNVGRGMITRWRKAGHELVLSDLGTLPDVEPFRGLPFVPCDIQTGFGLERAVFGCEAVLHLPAWHGIHLGTKTEIDFWRLNVDGSFWMFQAARAAGIKKILFLSSQAWEGHYDKYGFTKRVGEELCEYYRQNHGMRYVAVRPSDFTPWNSFANHYGPRLLHGGVDREDVLEGIDQSLKWLNRTDAQAASGHLSAIRHDPFSAVQLEGWSKDPLACLEKLFPGSPELVTRYGIDVKNVPSISAPITGPGDISAAIGYRATRHFGTFITELKKLDAEIGRDGVLTMRCPYAGS